MTAASPARGSGTTAAAGHNDGCPVTARRAPETGAAA